MIQNLWLRYISEALKSLHIIIHCLFMVDWPRINSQADPHWVRVNDERKSIHRSEKDAVLPFLAIPFGDQQQGRMTHIGTPCHAGLAAASVRWWCRSARCWSTFRTAPGAATRFVTKVFSVSLLRPTASSIRTVCARVRTHWIDLIRRITKAQ